MPYVKVNETKVYYEEFGNGPETIVFTHSLLCNLHMFDGQYEYFKDRYRCIGYDFRGQGKSEVTKGGYDVDTLVEDAQQFIKALDLAPCHFIGLSTGGFVGLRLGIRYPELLKSLVLMDTSMEMEDPSNLPRYGLLIKFAGWFGLKAVANKVLPIMFGPHFLNDKKNKDVIKKWKSDLFASSKKGVLRLVKAIIGRKGLTPEQVQQIKLPTLVMVGKEDAATPEHKAEKIHKNINGSILNFVPRAGHLSAMENPDFVNKTINEFINSLS